MLPCSTPWSNSGHGLNTVAYAITHRITSGNSTAEPKKNSTASDEVANECDRSGTLATCPKADINYLTCNNRDAEALRSGARSPRGPRSAPPSLRVAANQE